MKTVGVGKDPLRVVNKCIEEGEIAARSGKSFDDLVCLVDMDNHEKLPAAIELARANGVLLLISNLKFEVWLRWHAEDGSSPLTSSRLDARVKKLGLMEGKKLSRLFPYEAVEDACRRAHCAHPGMAVGLLGPDPSSAMPILIELMRGKLIHS